jgi:hypothetical protein
MAIIIETCPKCGFDLIDTVICTNPPIPKKGCPNCGWSWTGEPEEVVRVPFGGNSYVYEKCSSFYPDNNYSLIGSKYDEEVIGNLATTVSNYYGNTINTVEAMEAFAKTVEEYSNKLSEGLKEYNDNLIYHNLFKDFEIKQSACEDCPSNPKNGGDGICFCTAGQMHVAY